MIHLIPVVLVIVKTIGVYIVKYAIKAYKNYRARKEQEKSLPKTGIAPLKKSIVHPKKIRDALSPTLMFRYNKLFNKRKVHPEPLLPLKPKQCHMRLR
jgi:hypothetical protein